MKKILFSTLILLMVPRVIFPKDLLLKYGWNQYSQFGEDGVIQKIFEIIGTGSKIAVEFGAWDGFRFSNTAALWSTDISWKGVLIEGDPVRFEELQQRTKDHLNVYTINAWVGIEDDDCLDTLLEKHEILEQIDLLSIDIDGNDYHMFESLRKIRPRLIIIEYNPTIPFHYDVYAAYSPNNNFGQSVGALNRIAEKKGYKLIALTRTNALYVLKEEFEKFADFETGLQHMNVNDGYITVSTAYDGKYVLLKNKHSVYYYGIEGEFKGELKGAGDQCFLSKKKENTCGDTKQDTLRHVQAVYQKS